MEYYFLSPGIIPCKSENNVLKQQQQQQQQQENSADPTNFKLSTLIYLFVYLQSLEDEVQSYQPQFEVMKQSAQDISRATGDGRTASYAGQLFARYQTLAEAVKVMIT